MSPTIQLEIWKTFDPMTTAQTREKASRPIASRRSCPSGILADRWRGWPRQSARPVPAITIAGIVTWLKRNRLLNVAAIASDRNAPKSPAPSQPGDLARRMAVAPSQARPRSPMRTPCSAKKRSHSLWGAFRTGSPNCTDSWRYAR